MLLLAADGLADDFFPFLPDMTARRRVEHQGNGQAFLKCAPKASSLILYYRPLTLHSTEPDSIYTDIICLIDRYMCGIR
jgi:hypothetical protein